MQKATKKECTWNDLKAMNHNAKLMRRAVADNKIQEVEIAHQHDTVSKFIEQKQNEEAMGNRKYESRLAAQKMTIGHLRKVMKGMAPKETVYSFAYSKKLVKIQLKTIQRQRETIQRQNAEIERLTCNEYLMAEMSANHAKLAQKYENVCHELKKSTYDKMPKMTIEDLQTPASSCSPVAKKETAVPPAQINLLNSSI